MCCFYDSKGGVSCESFWQNLCENDDKNCGNACCDGKIDATDYFHSENRHNRGDEHVQKVSCNKC